MSKGGRNLMIMGLAAVVVAVVTTVVSVAIYHNSGDIYLDRSRPGYLPDEEEIEQDGEDQDDYELSGKGAVTAEALDEYLEHLQLELKALDGYGDPFTAEVLSDEHLGV